MSVTLFGHSVSAQNWSNTLFQLIGCLRTKYYHRPLRFCHFITWITMTGGKGLNAWLPTPRYSTESSDSTPSDTCGKCISIRIRYFELKKRIMSRSL